MRKTAERLAGIGMLVLFGFIAAKACDIGYYPPPLQFEKSDGVFVGRVIETGGWLRPFVVFRVEKSWKAIDTEEIELKVPHGCGGMTFAPGESYLVYAHESSGSLYTGEGSAWSLADDGNRRQHAESYLQYAESQPTLPLNGFYLRRNTKVLLLTTASVFIFLAFGYLLLRLKNKKKSF